MRHIGLCLKLMKTKSSFQPLKQILYSWCHLTFGKKNFKQYTSLILLTFWDSSSKFIRLSSREIVAHSAGIPYVFILSETEKVILVNSHLIITHFIFTGKI